MADQKNHSFISNSKIRLLTWNWLFFVLPIVVLYFAVEHVLGQAEYAEVVKRDLISRKGEEIEILFLGSSQVQRAINPRHISKPAINLANRSQMLYEDFEILKRFYPELPNLKILVLEVGFDKLERDKTYTSPSLDYKNLKFYEVNTFRRPVKFQDRFLFHSNPSYFADILNNHFFGTSKVELNAYGFDENKFDGSYNNNSEVFIENVQDEETYSENLAILHQMIRFGIGEGLNILIYHPPTHQPYNELRDPELVRKWHLLLKELKETYPEIRIKIDDTSSIFEREDFYNANHLNPKGAEKATKMLDTFLLKTYY